VNKIIVIDNLGRDPELRYTPTGQVVASFSVATNYRYRAANGEQREEAEWFNCQAFGKLAETCNQYLTKGQQVYVEGRLTSLTYQTRDGQTRFSNDITVREIQFLSGRGAGASVPLPGLVLQNRWILMTLLTFRSKPALCAPHGLSGLRKGIC
jgi:single-strand DNA-binding protein